MFDKEAYMHAMHYCLPVPEYHPDMPNHKRAIEALGHSGVSADFTSATPQEFTLAFSQLSGQALERLFVCYTNFMNLREVQDAQAAYDANFWAHQPGPDTICHSERHIGKLMGKIATVAEMYDHGEAPDLAQLDEEVIPDLLIFAARLANDRGIDLGEAFTARTEALGQKFSQAEKV